MKVRYTKSPKSTTIHFDTQRQALKLAASLLAVASDGRFPGSGITIFEEPKMKDKQQIANVAVMTVARRK
jgi:hypothetical protein